MFKFIQTPLVLDHRPEDPRVRSEGSIERSMITAFDSWCPISIASVARRKSRCNTVGSARSSVIGEEQTDAPSVVRE